jgi:predicted transcriptional regulator
LACYNDDENLEIYDSANDILKDLVKQDLVNSNYILIDESNEENISITAKGKQDYIKL